MVVFVYSIREGLGMKQLFLAAALTLAATAVQAQGYGTGSNPNSHGVSG